MYVYCIYMMYYQIQLEVQDKSTWDIVSQNE